MLLTIDFYHLYINFYYKEAGRVFHNNNNLAVQIKFVETTEFNYISCSITVLCSFHTSETISTIITLLRFAHRV